MAAAPYLVVTRPQPAAATLARRARALGFKPLLAPLLTVETLPPPPLPDWAPDALLLSSARAPARACAAYGEMLDGLPVFAVGPATAAAARRAGLVLAHVGASNASDALAAAAAAGHRRILHLRGADAAPLAVPPEVSVWPSPLYRAVATQALPQPVVAALSRTAQAIVPLFSPRSARLFAGLVDAAGLARGQLALVALSPAVAEAAGAGWRTLAVASRPGAAEALAVALRLWQGADDHG